METLFYSLFGLSIGLNFVFIVKNLRRKEVQKPIAPVDWRLSISNNLPSLINDK